MNLIKSINVLGIMSSTSFQEVGVSLITTDGIDINEFIGHMKVPYSEYLKDRIGSLLLMSYEELSNSEVVSEIEDEITDFYLEVIADFRDLYDAQIDLIGLEGPVVCLQEGGCLVKQIGNAQKISKVLEKEVVYNFHNADLMAGGKGFPLTPTFYSALLTEVDKPVAVVNLSGVSSIVCIGSSGEMVAFDAGPGNYSINDWTKSHASMSMDFNGKLAITGTVDAKILSSLMKHKYLAKIPPKSINEDIFYDKLEHLEGLSLEDGAATVTSFVAEAVAYSIALYLPEVPDNVFLSGGGTKNPTLVRFVKQKLPNMSVKVFDEIGFETDNLDAASIAFLAARRLNLMPASFPSTTGVVEPMICGEVVKSF